MQSFRPMYSDSAVEVATVGCRCVRHMRVVTLPVLVMITNIQPVVERAVSLQPPQSASTKPMMRGGSSESVSKQMPLSMVPAR